LLVDDLLQLLVDLLALRQQFVQLDLAEDTPQGRLEICDVARMKSATLTTAALGSTTRK